MILSRFLDVWMWLYLLVVLLSEANIQMWLLTFLFLHQVFLFNVKEIFKFPTPKTTFKWMTILCLVGWAVEYLESQLKLNYFVRPFESIWKSKGNVMMCSIDNTLIMTWHLTYLLANTTHYIKGLIGDTSIKRRYRAK